MKIFNLILAILLTLPLIGCGNVFEGKTCGIKNSQWMVMSDAQKLEIETYYHEKLHLADQLRVNKMLSKQQNKLVKKLKANEKRQKQRLTQEAKQIKKMQGQIDEALQAKQENYTN